MGKMPGDRWLSGPGVPQGEMGLRHRVEVRAVQVDEDAEPRHVDFDDPPGNATPAEYEEVLREAAVSAESFDQLAEAMVRSIAGDMIFFHHVAPHRAVEAVMRFAWRLYAEAHPDRES